MNQCDLFASKVNQNHFLIFDSLRRIEMNRFGPSPGKIYQKFYLEVFMGFSKYTSAFLQNFEKLKLLLGNG